VSLERIVRAFAMSDEASLNGSVYGAKLSN